MITLAFAADPPLHRTRRRAPPSATLDAMPEQRGLSTREDMPPEPSGESRLIQMSAGEGEDQ